MHDRIKFLLNRIREKLWVKPLFMCVLSVSGAFIARMADFTDVGPLVPDIALESVETLLSIMSSSMLVMATFSVASMVSAYASASGSATPRSFPLIIADDVSQNALSAFIGAFIFAIVAQISLENSYYDRAGRFALLVLTLLVFAAVIMTFVGWVDRIARLGRLGSTIAKVEAAAIAAAEERLREPRLGGVAVGERQDDDLAVYSDAIGYVQRIDVATLQAFAEKADVRVEIVALPGTFVTPDRPLAYVAVDASRQQGLDETPIADAFLLGNERTFDYDPRFGLIVLSEIASRALSPGINDSGTAIQVMGSVLRVLSLWCRPTSDAEEAEAKFDRVAAPELSVPDLFDDAFAAIGRDGAGTVEVVIRQMKALETLASTGNHTVREAARTHARILAARAEMALSIREDLEAVREAGRFARSDP